jgi:transketolase
MRDSFAQALTRLAERDPRIMLITGDLGFGVLTDFEKRFPRQFLNAGVAEQNMTGLATGLAMEGRIVFTYSIGNFPTLRCLEQIRNDACYHDANVKIAAVGGGFSYGALGISHHATEDLAILRALPGMTVVAPGDNWETAEATAAIVGTPGTCYLRLDRAGANLTPGEDEVFRLGEARVVRQGTDITLIACGGILANVLDAADRLGELGISCRVLSMHTLKPLDLGAVRAACLETGGIVTVEEHTVIGGLGGAVAEAILELGVMPRVFRSIGLRAGFSSIVGSQDYLRRAYGLDTPSITECVRTALSTPMTMSLPRSVPERREANIAT